MPYKDELELIFNIPNFHNPKKPSKSFLEQNNDLLIETNKSLQAEIDKLRLIIEEKELATVLIANEKK
jgi:hypothetical protein